MLLDAVTWRTLEACRGAGPGDISLTDGPALRTISLNSTHIGFPLCICRPITPRSMRFDDSLSITPEARFAVDGEHKAIAFDNHVHLVPNRRCECRRESARPPVPRKVFSPASSIVASTPRSTRLWPRQYPWKSHAPRVWAPIPTCPKSAVIAADAVCLRLPHQPAHVNPRVRGRTDAVRELQFKIAQLPARPNQVGALALRPADEHPVANRPVNGAFGGQHSPTVQSCAVEDTNEALIRGPGRNENDAKEDNKDQEPRHLELECCRHSPFQFILTAAPGSNRNGRTGAILSQTKSSGPLVLAGAGIADTCGLVRQTVRPQHARALDQRTQSPTRGRVHGT